MVLQVTKLRAARVGCNIRLVASHPRSADVAFVRDSAAPCRAGIQGSAVGPVTGASPENRRVHREIAEQMCRSAPTDPEDLNAGPREALLFVAREHLMRTPTRQENR
jgi:hypothetical protein